MSDDWLRDVWVPAQAERAADVGSGPRNWSVILRRRRRLTLAAMWAGVAYWASVDLLRLVIADRPPEPFHLVVSAVWVGLLGSRVYAMSTAAGRVRWAEETEVEIRLEQALRRRVSPGLADRDLVNERAEKIVSWALGHLVGWPLLGVMALAIVVDGPDLSRTQELGAAVLVVVVVAALVVRSRRRLRWARRWLADPLPRDAGGQPWADRDPLSGCGGAAP